MQLELSLEQARIYSIRSGDRYIRLEGYVVAQGAPLVVSLEVGGAQASLDTLREVGLLEDFSVIVESITPVSPTPGSSSTPLP